MRASKVWNCASKHDTTNLFIWMSLRSNDTPHTPFFTLVCHRTCGKEEKEAHDVSRVSSGTAAQDHPDRGINKQLWNNICNSDVDAYYHTSTCAPQAGRRLPCSNDSSDDGNVTDAAYAKRIAAVRSNIETIQNAKAGRTLFIFRSNILTSPLS